MKKLLFLIFIFVIVLVGCGKQAANTADKVIDAATGIGAIEKKIQAEVDLAKVQCIELCLGAEREELDLTQGPCLGNPITNMADWVCDVAHNPRQDVDNKTENQCSAFRDGTAKHFVEVDFWCNFIKSY